MTHNEKITNTLSVKIEAGCFNPELTDNICPTRLGNCLTCSHCQVSMTAGDYIALRDAAQVQMTRDADKVLEMAKDMINLELRLIKNSIGRGNCPFAVSPLKTRLNIDCSTTDCRDCSDMWAKAKRKEIIEEVITRYDLQEIEGE